MLDGHAPQFGALPVGQEAVERSGAYGVVFDTAKAARVLIVRYRQRYFLPGGGQHVDEQPRQALMRELLEETGHAPVSMHLIGAARQYVLDTTTARWWNKHCTFYVVRVGGRVREAPEQGLEPVWIPSQQAAALLCEDASSWAVQRAFTRLRDEAAHAPPLPPQDKARVG